MSIRSQRAWMYNRLLPGREGLTVEFFNGVNYFISVACQQSNFDNGMKIRCPCSKHKNEKYLTVDEVKYDLYRRGFKPDYFVWTSHGEVEQSFATHGYGSINCSQSSEEHINRYEDMIQDAVGPQNTEFTEEAPNNDAQQFYELLNAAQKPLWPGCTNHTELSVAIRMLSIKTEFNMSRDCFNQFAGLLKETNPRGNLVPADLYRTKKIVSKLGLNAVKIDCCVNGCMLYYKDDVTAVECKYCAAARYKPKNKKQSKQKNVPHKRLFYLPIIPRLKRLYASMNSAAHMRWHHERISEPDILCHPSDAEAWKDFDRTHINFASEPRNVRLGLCTDGFTPYSNAAAPYSCWPVILTPYNLPPDLCMTSPYMFLTLIIPGPNNPKGKIDVYLQPLIDDLKILWEGVYTYDISRKQNFLMKAALLWTIGDFPAYGMLSGWSTAGKLACPYCMESTKSFTLKNGGKNSWFDCHRMFLPADHAFRRNKNAFLKNKVERSNPPPRLSGQQLWEKITSIPKITESPDLSNTKLNNYGVTHNWTKRSIFWDLPYWRTNLIRHNLDVMHIEKNFFDNIFNTVMDIKGRTKDNLKARMDLKEYCKRRELELQESSNGRILKPKAKYCLTLDQRRAVCEWVQSLKMPDGYASNLSRCVDIRGGRLFGMKSHDCHIFMEYLLSMAFINLPEIIWNPLTELSQFFKDICSTRLNEETLRQSELQIPLILCKLERIFPPGFFDSMEHLPIHLPYEARVGGPVQYRWMYPFERFLNKIKRTVKNKARPEGSICEAYVAQETTYFCSYYFEPDVQCSRTRVGRNEDVDEEGDKSQSSLSIFQITGRASGKFTPRHLNDKERDAATLFVLQNCEEVQPFYE